MKPIPFLLAHAAIACHCHGGNLNIVDLGPEKKITLEVDAGKLTQQFSLSYQEASGFFIIPDKKAALIKIIDSEIPTLKVPSKTTGQIAVLHPAAETFKWSLYASTPTEGKTSLRLINLTDEEVNISQGDTQLTLKAASELPVPQVTSAPIRLSFEAGKKVRPHEQEEPSAVIGFVYKTDAEWKIFYVDDI